MGPDIKVIVEEEVRRLLPWPRIIAAIEELIARGCEAPERHVHPIATGQGPDASLLLMPAWVSGEWIGVKIVTFFPGNAERALPAIGGAYVLFDGATGRLAGIVEAEELTARRTAAASACAAKRLARPDAARLLVAGTGRLSANLAAAHAAVRPIREVVVHGRSPDKAEWVAASLRETGLAARASENLAESVAAADIVSCATTATEPLIRGGWLRPGTHVDLVGSFRPDMREADDEVMRRASIFVDGWAGASQAGDLAQPLATGIIDRSAVKGDLRDLVLGSHPGRVSRDEITVFKSVGLALEDLAAARAIMAERDAGR